MKKGVSIIMILFAFCITILQAQVTDTIVLPQPQKTGGMPLYDALSNRKSSRNFSEKHLNYQLISNLLWAGSGINRTDGHRTAPSARNWQEIDIYVVMAEGWYIYDPVHHSLLKMSDIDIRIHTGTQEFVSSAPLNLLYIADYSRMKDTDDETRKFYAAADAGFIAQNIYLSCASEGLATVIRGSIDRERIREMFNLKTYQHPILGQTIGYSEE